MSHKQYHLAAELIKPVAVGFGACYATDRIVVDGKLVGYCYREEPDNSVDSGWRFFAGDESQDYLNNPSNLALYDINTIANYDPAITALLEAPTGTAFERDETGCFVAIVDDET